jgi:glycosyltransferase involved in cell wall biosynthesis
MIIPSKNSFQESSEDTRDLTLLVLTPDFPDKDQRYIGSIYVKSQLEQLKQHFKAVIVICPVLFSFRLLPNDRYCSNYGYNNVNVYYPRCFFLPRILRIPFMDNKQKLLFDFRYSAVRRLIERENISFDLIHAHFTWPSAVIAVRLKEEFHVPVIATLHEDSGWLNEEIAMDDPQMINAWRNSDALIRVNKTDVPVLQTYNPSVYAIPNGFTSEYKPLDMAECRKKLGLPAGKIILFTFGDLLERKGFQYLIDAMEILSGQRKDLRCYISGKGSYKNRLKCQVERLGLQDSVIILDYIQTGELPIWINSANLFVFPSLQESFGIVQIEALACGKPVIAAQNAGSTDVISSAEVGILCEPGSAESLADAITRGITRDWDTVKIIEYSGQYRWESIVQRLMRIYGTVLKKSDSAQDD